MKHLLILLAIFIQTLCINAQELNCTVKVNRSQVQGTKTSVFETLEKAVNDFMNNRSWTDLQYAKDERINCTMTITVKQYKADNGQFTCDMQFQVTRPVFNSSYSSTIFSRRDTDFEFTYEEGEPLEFNENSITNNLTAMLAYYAYFFIGIDLDTFSPLGGTDVLHKVESIVNDAQMITNKGWQAFGDNKNRHAIINDYMETSMEPMRQLMYKYHRKGLDEMASNADRGRAVITECVEMLKEAHSSKPLSLLPQIFTDFKRDELVGIYRGHGTENEKKTVFDILSEINAAQSIEWRKMQK